MPRVELCTETAPWCFHVCATMCVSVRVSVCVIVSVKPHRSRKSISKVMKMQIVSLVSTCAVNQHHNTPSPFNLSQNGPRSTWTWLGQISPPNHFPHSLQINQSPLLLCSLLMSILYSSIDFCHQSILSELLCLYPSFQQFPSVPSRGRFCNWYKKKLGNEKR